MTTENESGVLSEEWLINERLKDVFELTQGEVIQNTIIELARETGVELPPSSQGERYAVNRLALSPNEFITRASLSKYMREAGMDIQDHPLGIIGSYKGIDASLSPLVLMSHYDAVPKGGMYDGIVGLAAAIHVVKAFNTLDIHMKRPLSVLALTGEESSRFNIALFGSRGIFHGLTAEELSSKRQGDVSIQQALENAGYSVSEVIEPLFTKTNIYATVELHVDQTGMLEALKKDFAIVHAIAAPDRREIVIESETNYPFQDFSPTNEFNIEVTGKSGHSGATPMGKEFRADGFVVSAEFISHIDVLNTNLAAMDLGTSVVVGSVSIADQSLNKIPGKVRLSVQIYGNDPQATKYINADLQEFIKRRNEHSARESTLFGSRPISININGDQKNDLEKRNGDASPNFKLAARIAMMVHTICNQHQYRNSNIVGTVGTCSQTEKGQLILGLDVRGINEDLRNQVMEQILTNTNIIADRLKAHYTVRQLPGSGVPVQLSPDIASIIEKVMIEHNLGDYVFTHSPAGHDTMNAATAGIPASLLFIPSENGGAAHTPMEYTSPEALEKGAKALAAIVYRLGN